MQAQLFQLSIVSRYVSTNLIFKRKAYIFFFISECVCNSVGSTSLDCDENYGNCSCKEGFTGIKCHKCMLNVIGDKCDTCQSGYFNYPSCQEGMSIIISLSQYYVVILMHFFSHRGENFDCRWQSCFG